MKPLYVLQFFQMIVKDSVDSVNAYLTLDQVFEKFIKSVFKLELPVGLPPMSFLHHKVEAEQGSKSGLRPLYQLLLASQRLQKNKSKLLEKE